MKKTISLSLCLFMLIGIASVFAGGGGGDRARRFDLTMASTYARASPPIVAAIRFADEVRAATNGAVNINVFSDGVLGPERDLILQLAADELEFAVVGVMPVDMFAPEFGFMTAPFLYRNMDHVRAIFASHLGDALRGRLLENNINFLAEMWRGERHTISNIPIRNPDDVRGVRVRMTEVPSWIAVWRDGLGATTIPIALAEVYTALQTGVADAKEGPYEQHATFRFYEVQRYLINTGHVMEFCGIYASQRALDRLPREYYRILVQKGREIMTLWGTQLAYEQAEQFRQQLLRGGMTEINVNVPDFTARLMPTFEQFFADGTWTSSLSEIQAFAR